MAELVPVPFGVLVTRLLRELEERGSAFDLPARFFVRAEPGRDWSVRIHGRRVSTPFGPAAGPHTQLAQNLVPAWLVGGRFLELKTIQVKDDLVIPRPCIDMQTVGYNVEWSQELTLEQSREEYVKAAMLVELLEAQGAAAPGQGLGDTVLDMSVGYDLAGIRSPRVRSFLAGMADARDAVDRLRREIPARWAHLRDLPFPTRISDTLTLSTFHGCPSREVEQIAAHLLEEEGLHVVVKLNPTLLGAADLRALLRERLGYADLRVPDAAFEGDPTWEQVAGMVERLGARARRLGRGFGVKLTNTLVVENHRSFFPTSEKVMYLSGPPLHVVAAELVRRFRRAFGDSYPISFSAGVDAANFPDLCAIGLAPITACTDLLRAGGYGRGRRYFTELSARMAACGAADLEELALKRFGHAAAALEDLALPPERAAACRAALAAGGDGGALRAAAGDRFGAWVSAARVRNTETYVEAALADPRYREDRNRTPPRKVGSKLALFDCLTCDKCIPVCPNDANFSLDLPPGELPLERLVPAGPGRFALERTGTLTLRRERQIANYADACNECGHCDVLCPEDGGPYVVKPRFFGSVRSWAELPGHDGFALEPLPGGHRMHGRFGGKVYVVERVGARVRYEGEGFALELDPADPAGTARGAAAGPVDLAYLRIMERLRDAVIAPGAVNWVSAGVGTGAGTR